MKTRTLLILIALAAVILVGSVSLYARRSTRFAPPTPEVLYPNLIDNVQRISRITVQGPDGTLTIERAGDTWGMIEKGGYVIRTERIRAAVLTLSNLRVIEPKTSKPENYHLLGLADPGEESEAVHVRMTDESGRDMVAVTLGRVERSEGPGIHRRYVRLDDDPTVYYVDGGVEITSKWNLWIDREILRVFRNWTHEITISHPDGDTVRVQRPDTEARDFTLATLPPGAELIDPLDVNLIGNTFIYMGLEDVAADDTSADIKPGPVVTARTFDGLVITARLFDAGDQTWATFSASTADPVESVINAQRELAESQPDFNPVTLLRPFDEIQRIAAEMNDRLAGWRFRLTEDKTKLISMRSSDLYRVP